MPVFPEKLYYDFHRQNKQTNRKNKWKSEIKTNVQKKYKELRTIEKGEKIYIKKCKIENLNKINNKKNNNKGKKNRKKYHKK